MWKVISPKSCRDSAKTLELGLNEFFPLKLSDKIINWGCSSINKTEHYKVYGNKQEAVYRSTIKPVMFDLLKDYGPVPVTTEFVKPGVFQHHANLSDGKGVQYVNKKEDFIPGVLSTKKITGSEWRVYFSYGKILGIYKKTKVSSFKNKKEIHNSTNGWGYLLNPTELTTIEDFDTILRSWTIRTAKRMELVMGAVDFILEYKTRLVYILETNSAPTLITPELGYHFAENIYNNIGNERKNQT